MMQTLEHIAEGWNDLLHQKKKKEEEYNTCEILPGSNKNIIFSEK